MTHLGALREFIYKELNGKVKTKDGHVIGLYDNIKDPRDTQLVWLLFTTESEVRIFASSSDIRKVTITLQLLQAADQFVNKATIDEIQSSIEDNLLHNGVGKSFDDDYFYCNNLQMINSDVSLSAFIAGNTKIMINKNFTITAVIGKKNIN